MMYSNILVASDGSELSGKAVTSAINLAGYCNALVIALNVQAPFQPPIAGEVPATFIHNPDEYDEMARENSRAILDDICTQAQIAGVRCEPLTVFDQSISQAIVSTAEEKGVDLIVIASHGRSAIKSLIMGSETRNVLIGCKIPVLVHR